MFASAATVQEGPTERNVYGLEKAEESSELNRGRKEKFKFARAEGDHRSFLEVTDACVRTVCPAVLRISGRAGSH